MNQFSIYNFKKLSSSLKAEFIKEFTHNLRPLLDEIKKDDVLGSEAIINFITSSDNSTSAISDLYTTISAGIQAGSGNQILYNAILVVFVKCWDKIREKE